MKNIPTYLLKVPVFLHCFLDKMFEIILFTNSFNFFSYVYSEAHSCLFGYIIQVFLARSTASFISLIMFTYSNNMKVYVLTNIFPKQSFLISQIFMLYSIKVLQLICMREVDSVIICQFGNVAGFSFYFKLTAGGAARTFDPARASS